jgi:hypothetical protein
LPTAVISASNNPISWICCVCHLIGELLLKI